MSSADAHGTTEGAALRQLVTIGLLICGVLLLHAFSRVQEGQLDPTAMLALGFVVLASFAVGSLVAIVKLPHITGYLIAGLVFGPSLAELVSSWLVNWVVLPPFDRGVLNKDVISQLSLLDTLAVALIALNAGGELKIEGLKRGFRAIAGVITFQYFAVMFGVTALVVAISGPLGPAFTLPGYPSAPLLATIAVGAMVAAISFATSPAATIAVINETRATGPMSRTVLSAVVLKDVIVVVTFAVTQVIAAQLLGVTAIEGGLAAYLFQHIGMSMLLGAAVGGLLALYLRFVNKEVLLFWSALCTQARTSQPNCTGTPC